MCQNPLYCVRLRDEFDIKYKRTGVRSQLIVIGSVSKIDIVDVKRMYPEDKYYYLLKECGSCLTCRYKQSAQRAAQSYCESKLHKDNSFITLTFGDDDIYRYLRQDKKMSRYKAKKLVAFWTWSLDNKLFSDFMKRLRQTLYREKLTQWFFDNNLAHLLVKDKEKGEFYKSPDYIVKKYYLTNIAPKPDCIRLLHCGEYGSNPASQRPHHHVTIFGYNPKDTYVENIYRQGQPYKRLRSKTLDKLWKFGAHQVDGCSYNAINYVSRYVTKKVVGKASDIWYNGRKPDYITCSTSSGGLGKEYFLKHFNMFKTRKKVDCFSKYKKGYIPVGLPRYFKELWKRIEPDTYNKYISEQLNKMHDDFNNMIKDPCYQIDKSCSFNAQGVKTLKIHRELIRELERSESSAYSVIERKARAFGVPVKSIEVYKDVIGCYLSKQNYKQFTDKYKNKDLFDKVVNFEKFRKKQIKFAKNQNMDNIVYLYENMRNPFKKKGYTSKYQNFVLDEDFDSLKLDLEKLFNVA